MIVHTSRIFSNIMTSIALICAVITIAFVYMAYFHPDELAIVVPQIVDGVKNAVGVVKNDINNL